MIKVQDLHKKFQKNIVLSGVNLELKESGIYSILGPNGSGKTTLIKSILGMVLPTKGSIKINDKSIKAAWDYRKQIDYLPQIANFPSNLKVKELISMIKDLRGNSKRDKELINLFGVEKFLDKKVGTLSGGMKQKTNIVLAFMFDSPILILDEPTTGLDPVALIHLKELIQKEKERGKLILITSHIMSFVEEITDEIVFLLEGNVHFEGNISELKKQTSEQNFEKAIASLLISNHV
ncbi:MAG: ABC transporter ATP-binding protein [Flavobacteriales bacterium]|nr:ABC transporter ATP-binding protein [Flavobacteriales bacterium]